MISTFHIIFADPKKHGFGSISIFRLNYNFSEHFSIWFFTNHNTSKSWVYTISNFLWSYSLNWHLTSFISILFSKRTACFSQLVTFFFYPMAVISGLLSSNNNLSVCIETSHKNLQLLKWRKCFWHCVKVGPRLIPKM